MGHLIVILLFLFLGWFGAKLISMGLAGIKNQALDAGFKYRLQRHPARIVGAFLLLAGLLVIAPFVGGVARLLLEVVGRDFSPQG
jgi:hypothetical protein